MLGGGGGCNPSNPPPRSGPAAPSVAAFPYKDQSCTVKWNSYEDNPLGVSNGVRQFLSPILFTVYLELLQRLTALDIGCHVGHHYAVMLMTSPSLPLLHQPLEFSMRTFASEHNVQFNAAKTQLICFRSSSKVTYSGKFFMGHPLEFSDHVTHLGPHSSMFSR